MNKESLQLVECGQIVEQWPPRLNAVQALRYTALTAGQLKSLRRARAIRYYRTGHRSVSYDRDSLQSWLEARAVESL